MPNFVNISRRIQKFSIQGLAVNLLYILHSLQLTIPLSSKFSHLMMNGLCMKEADDRQHESDWLYVNRQNRNAAIIF